MMEAVQGRLSEVERNALDRPLDLEELRSVLQKGGGNKAPGRDGICRTFFTDTWADLKEDRLELFSDMFERGRLLAQQKNGVIACIPKTMSPTWPRDYRPITLLNTDYKIFARILAGSVQIVLGDVLHPNQYCGSPGKSIFDAVATVRDAIAYAAVSRTPLCVLSLDYAEVFDKMSHTYLFEILRSYGFSERLLERVRMMYTKAVSVVQINGHMSGPLPVGCSIRIGCPLSMALFALCINPLIQCLEENLQGVRFNRGPRKVAVVAYSDDITILVTASEDIEWLKEIVQ
jgi:hypothetical protein